MGSSEAKRVGVLTLALINVAAVLGLRNLPAMAVYGWSSVGWYLLGTIAFLLPIALAGVELSTTWQKGGGLFGWVREAFGEEVGFFAIFCEWSNLLVWYPAVLAFIASTLAFAVNPDLASDNRFMFVVMMAVFWVSTGVALFGSRASRLLGTFGVFAGTIVPALLICGFGIAFILSGERSELPPFALGDLLPDFSLTTLPLAGVAILTFAGMEMIGFHAGDVRNPRRDLSRAMAVSAAIIFVLTVLGTLAVAWVVPKSQLSLAAGLMQAFSAFFDDFGVGWLLTPLALLVALGAIACLQTWLTGPASGLHVAVNRGFMPPMFARLNRFGAPAPVLLLQAGIGTVIAVAYLFAPGINTVYWMLSAMTTLLICIMYVAIFASFIRLRYVKPDVERPFRVPGGMPGAWICGGLGAAACAATFFISLLPPSEAQFGSTWTYVLVMLAGVAALTSPALVLSWRTRARRAARGAGHDDAEEGAGS